MTVAELIAELKTMPSEAILMSCYDVHDGELGEVYGITLHEDGYAKTRDPEYKGKKIVEL